MVFKKRNINFITFLLIFISITLFVLFQNQNNYIFQFFVNSSYFNGAGWSNNFEIVNIKSSNDNQIQKAYFYKTKSNELKPLIVSLHTWEGDYAQYDELAKICKKGDVNYIHPNFRGPNLSKDACCSKLAISDIDDAITYAIKNANVDTTKINVIGVSGGGYATLCSFMKSTHHINMFSAWNSITDLIEWYDDTNLKNGKYSQYILDCTGSVNELNKNKAKLRSPIYWNTPLERRSNSKLYIYAGILDGIQGPVPITQSIKFYNKLLSDMSVNDSSKYVSNYELIKLLKFRKPIGNYGLINGKKICLKKEFKNIRIIIFEGKHEILPKFAINELLKD